MSSAFPPTPPQLPLTLQLTVLCAALNSCNLGYDLGITADVTPLLENAFNLSEDDVSLFVGSLNFFALIGALVSPRVSDALGRR